MSSQEASQDRISAKELFVSDIRYSGWANLRLLNACNDLTSEELLRDLKVSHRSILATLLHIYDAERVWLDWGLAQL